MIHPLTNYTRTDRTESLDVSVPSVPKITHNRVLQLVKQALVDFSQKTFLDKDSFSDRKTTLKINWLNELLKEKLGNLEFDDESVDSYLTTTDRQLIRSQIRKTLKGIGDTQVSEVMREIVSVFSEIKADALSGNSKSKSRGLSVQIDLGEYDNGKFLEEYFDNLYSKSEKYKDLKDDIVQEMLDHHNDNMRLFRERIQQYKDGLSRYAEALKKANDRISELSKGGGKQGERKNSILKRMVSNIPKVKNPNGVVNVIKDDSLTQKIVDQIRKNENMAAAPKQKELSAEHMGYAKNLVTKFYENGKAELSLKKIKIGLGVFGKVFGLAMSPISWAAKKMWNLSKSIFKSVFKLGKFIFEKSQTFIFAALASPTGAYSIGFIAGFVSELLLEKWDSFKKWMFGSDEDPTWFGSLWKGIKDGFITPMINVVKWIWGIGKWFVDFAAEHPLITMGLVACLKGLMFAIKNFSAISKGVGIVKRGIKGAGPLLVGLATSAATEAIFDNTVFKSKTDDGLNYMKTASNKYQQFSAQTNQDTVTSLNDQDLGKYQSLKQGMDDEYKELTELQSAIEFVNDNFKTDEDKKKSIEQLLGKGFIASVFSSKMFGFNRDGFDRFLERPGKTLPDQINNIMGEINARYNILNRTQGTITEASKHGVQMLSKSLEDIVTRTPETKMDKSGKEIESGKFKFQMNKQWMDRQRQAPLLNNSATSEETFSSSGYGGLNPYKPAVPKKIEEGNFIARWFGNMDVDGTAATAAYIAHGTKQLTDKNFSEDVLIGESTERYTKEHGFDNTAFQQFMKRDEIERIRKEANGDVNELSNRLQKYLDTVRNRFELQGKSEMDLLRERIDGLNGDISRLESDIRYFKDKKTGLLMEGAEK